MIWDLEVFKFIFGISFCVIVALLVFGIVAHLVNNINNGWGNEELKDFRDREEINGD